MVSKEWIKRLFAVSAFISCFTCYDRADYNLPLFAFAYLLWDQPKPVPQKVRLTYLFIFTAIFDLVWLCYWWPFWDEKEFDNNWAKGIQSFVIALSFINFLIKIAIIGLCWQTERDCQDALSIEGFKRNCLDLVNFNKPPVFSQNRYVQ